MSNTYPAHKAQRAIRAWKIYAGFGPGIDDMMPRAFRDLEETLVKLPDAETRKAHLYSSPLLADWMTARAVERCDPASVPLVSPWRYEAQSGRTVTSSNPRRGVFFFRNGADDTAKAYLAASDAVTIGRAVGPIRPDPNAELAAHGSCHAPAYLIEEIILDDYWLPKCAEALHARYGVPVRGWIDT